MAEINNPGAFKAYTDNDVTVENGVRCIQCDSGEFTLLRKDPEGTNHKLRCLDCKFTFMADTAKALKEQLEKADPDAVGVEPDREDAPTIEDTIQTKIHTLPADKSYKIQTPVSIPRTPKYLFVAKDRQLHEIVGARQFKKTALAWEQRGKYDVFELTAKKMNVKITI